MMSGDETVETCCDFIVDNTDFFSLTHTCMVTLEQDAIYRRGKSHYILTDTSVWTRSVFFNKNFHLKVPLCNK